MRQRLLIILCFLSLSLNMAEAQPLTITEQEMVNFLAVLPTMPMATGRAKVDSLVDSLRCDMPQLDKVLDWAATYLLDSRSPIYNPSLYDSLFIMDSPGRRPLDFSFVDTLEHKSSLHAIVQSYTLPTTFCNNSSEATDSIVLFFYSADCDHCTMLLQQWHEHPELLPDNLCNRQVLAVCLDDDETLWRKSIRLLPKEWVPVRDLDGLLVRRRYDLRQLPHTSVAVVAHM